MRRQYCSCVAAFVMLAAAATAGQTIPEFARAHPNTPIVGGMTRHAHPVDLETLLKESALVGIGRLHLTRSYLTPDQTDTLSDYAIQLEQVLAGVVPVARAAPGQSSSPILTIYGGDITIDGRKASVEMMNTERPKSGQRFLMFLQPYGTEAGRYKIAYGAILEIENGRLRSLLKMPGGADPFREVTDHSLPAAVQEIARRRR